MASNVYLAEEMSGVVLDVVTDIEKTSDSGGELTFHQHLYLPNS